MKLRQAVIFGFCVLALSTNWGRADDLDVLTATDWSYLGRFGVKPETFALKHMDLRQKVHLHQLINDPAIPNRDREVDFYLDYVTMCPLKLAEAGVGTGDCDKPPPGHP